MCSPADHQARARVAGQHRPARTQRARQGDTRLPGRRAGGVLVHGRALGADRLHVVLYQGEASDALERNLTKASG